MEKIIICGDEKQVRKIQSRLNPQTTEQNALDLSKECCSLNLAADNSIFVAADDVQESILLSLGITADKVINYSRFAKTSLDSPLDKMDCDMQYTGLVMGMSHAQCAIDPKQLTDQVYCNIAAPSMDMFCHYKYMTKLADMCPEKLANIKSIIIELPYYIFNYDLSQFGTFVYTKLNYFELVGDYHHFGESVEQEQRIAEFRRFKKLFKQEEPKMNTGSKRNPLRIVAKKLLNKYRVATNKDKVWHVVYEDTVRENKKIWREFLNLLTEVCPAAEITVLVMPFNPLFRQFHKKIINTMKLVFMDSLGTGKFQIVDHFAKLNSDRYFDDHCHLNKTGAAKYLEILRETFSAR